MVTKHRGLERGLDALLGADETPSRAAGDTLAKLKIEQLQPGRYQPRSHMDTASLEDLAASIKAQGLMQPILADRFRGAEAAGQLCQFPDHQWVCAGPDLQRP